MLEWCYDLTFVWRKGGIACFVLYHAYQSAFAVDSQNRPSYPLALQSKFGIFILCIINSNIHIIGDEEMLHSNCKLKPFLTTVVVLQ